MSDRLGTYDIFAVTAALVLFVGYHVHLYIVKPQLLGGQLPFALNRINAEIWLLKHKEKANESPVVLLAIQTLRNTMMAAVFVGGNAITIAYDMSNDYNGLKDERLKVRSLIICVCMFSSFLCWANVIRLASMVGYHLGTLQYAEKIRKEYLERERERNESAKEAALAAEAAFRGNSADYTLLMAAQDNEGSPRDDYAVNDVNLTAESIPDIHKECSIMMKMITIFFSFGFRLMFVAIPFAFYCAGPSSLLVTSFFMFLFLLSYDHVRHKDHKAHKD